MEGTGEIGVHHRFFRPVHLQGHGDILCRVKKGVDDVDFLGRHTVEPVNPDVGGRKGGGLWNFPGQQVEKASLVVEMVLQVAVVGTVQEGEVRHLPPQRAVSLGCGGIFQILLRYAEHIQLVEKAGEFL